MVDDMSATSIRYVTSIPAGGLKFDGSPQVEINTITPLGVGDLVIKPSTPLDGRLTETIPVDASLVGSSIPGAGALLIDETTTSLPLIVVLAAVGAMPHHVMVPGASSGGGGAGAATEAKQDEQIVQAATLISNTTGLALDATVVLVKDAIDALKGNGVLDATLYDILIELETRGALDSAALSNIETATSDSAIKLDSILSSSQTIETYTDNLETLIAITNTKLDDLKTAVETSQAETTRFVKSPSIWKSYATIPIGGLDIAAEFPGKTMERVETYAEGVLAMRPAGDAGNVVTSNTSYGWTWVVEAATIEDTTTALPLIVYWS
jgi:hypothetical protein